MPRSEENIRDKTAKIGVIGLGYVGLPLAIAFAEAGFRVLGFDVQQDRVDAVNRGQSYIADITRLRLEPLVHRGAIKATVNMSRLSEADAACICVPTPLTKYHEPDLSHVVNTAREVARHVRPGQVIILESTTCPGTTRDVILPILEGEKLVLDKDFYLAFSPERIDPGNKRHNVKNIPKIVGGVSPKSTELAVLLYSQIAEHVVPVSSPEVAEMGKIFENVFRSVNIALVNEMAQLCEMMGISMWEVIEAADSKPFGYMPFYPGPGIGGHCVPFDPYFLANKALEYDFHTRFIELAAEINEGMPFKVVARIMEALNKHGKSLSGAEVLVLGVAYKKDCEDGRNSPSLKIIDLLQKKGANVSYNDPYIKQVTTSAGPLESVEPSEEALSAADCVVIATDHSSYDLEQVAAGSQLVFDTRGVTRKLKKQANIVRLGEYKRL